MILRNFHFSKFRFKARAGEPILLPAYKGSIFRGGFGYAFRKVACALKNQDCHSCLLKEKCIYSYVFETPPPKNSSVMKKYTNAPHPFIITPPLDKKIAYRPDEEFSFEITLIGKTIDYLPYFVYTIKELGKMGIGRGRGKYQLAEVYNIDALGKPILIYNGQDEILLSDCKKMGLDDFTFPKQDSDHLTLEFITPARIKFGQTYVSELEFQIFFRNLLRRIYLLYYFHCGHEPDVDLKEMAKKAKEIKTEESSLTWHDWERYSTRQKTRMKLGGLKGKVTFKGDFKEFLPFIVLGESINVGKGTSFGLGKYRILR